MNSGAHARGKGDHDIMAAGHKHIDGRRASTILCSRSGGDAREAMTVGCKPTNKHKAAQPGFAYVMVLIPFTGLRGSFLRFPPIGCFNNKAWGPQANYFKQIINLY